MAEDEQTSRAPAPLAEESTIVVMKSTETTPMDGAEALMHLMLSITTEQAPADGDGYSN